MAAETITPTCEVTGLPLPIHPDGSRISEARFDFHPPPDRHHAFHPERSQALKTVAGLAVRKSRIQLVDYRIHHLGYHNVFEGPELPDNDSYAFRLSLLAVAGVVPRKTIKMIGEDDYEIVSAHDRLHRRISRDTKIDSAQEVSKFFTQHAVNLGIEQKIKQENIDELLDNHTPLERRRKIASVMVAEAMNVEVERLSLVDMHHVLHKEGLLDCDVKPKSLTWTAKRLVRMYHLDYFRKLMQDRVSTDGLQTGVTTV